MELKLKSWFAGWNFQMVKFSYDGKVLCQNKAKSYFHNLIKAARMQIALWPNFTNFLIKIKIGHFQEKKFFDRTSSRLGAGGLPEQSRFKFKFPANMMTCFEKSKKWKWKVIWQKWKWKVIWKNIIQAWKVEANGLPQNNSVLKLQLASKSFDEKFCSESIKWAK